MKYTHVTQSLALLFLATVLVGGQVLMAAAQPACDPEKTPLLCDQNPNLYLLQPIDENTREIAPDPEPLGIFFTYFNMAWPWIIGIASGIAVLQAVYGGILIMTSSGSIDDGKQKIQGAVIGMVIIALAGFILRLLNPIFYQ